jgi:transmembrane sensor
MNDEPSPPVPPPLAPVPRHTVLDWARDAGAGDLLAGGLNRYLQRQRRRRLALASAACAVLLAGGAAWLRFRDTASPSPLSPQIARASATTTATVLRPEQRTLPDGTTVDLNAGAEIEVNFTASFRRITLRQGEAHFQVTKDAQRPFIVTAGAIEVRAVGTAFAVELGSSAVDVLVTEGRVAVNPADASLSPTRPSPTVAPPPSPAPPLAAVGAGERVVIDRIDRAPSASPRGNPVPARVTQLSAADINARLGWRVARLKFAATPLTQVVAMFNEHAVSGDARLVLAPDVPSDLRVSGTLRADDVDSLLRLLAGEFGISGESRPGEIILRRK